MSIVNLANHAHQENGAKMLYIEEKLANLPPSKEILDFYRKQIKSLEDDNIAINKKLEEYKLLCDDYHNALLTIRNYGTEVHDLQKALSDLQECLFQEQDHKDRLKAELQASKFCQSNKLHMAGQLRQKVISHRSYKQKENMDTDMPMRDHFTQARTTCDPLKQEGDEILSYQVESLRKQLNDQSSAFEEKLSRVLEGERKRCERMEEQKKEDKEMINMLIKKLKRAQDMLHDSTKELIDLRKNHHEEALAWMEEKEKLMQEVKFSRKEAANVAKKTMNVVEQKLRDADKWNDLMRAKLDKLNDKMINIKEEYELKNKELEERLEQTTSCLSILSKRYKDLEARRRLEIEGYKTDVNHLRNKLEIAETQCYKIALNYSKDLGLCDNDDEDGYDWHDYKKNEFHVKIPRKVVSSRNLLKTGKSLTLKSHRNKSRKH